MKTFFQLLFSICFLNAEAQLGGLDPSFGQGGRVLISFNGTTPEHDPRAVATQPDGRIVVAGVGFHLPGVAKSHICLARLLPDGKPDPEFSGDGKAGFVIDSTAAFQVPRALRILSNGKILILANAGKDLYFMRLLANGNPDPDFGSQGVLKLKRPLPNENATFINSDILTQTNGQILVFYRQVYTGLGTTIHVLHRFHSNGAPDNSLGGTGRIVVDSSLVPINKPAAFTNAFMSLASGNKIILGGDTSLNAATSNDFRVKVIRLNFDGTPDKTFGTGGSKVYSNVPMLVNGLAVDPAQNLVLTGMIGGENAVMRVKPNGDPDPEFGIGGVSKEGPSHFITVNFGLALSGEKIVVGGIRFFDPDFQTQCKSFGPKGKIDAGFGNGGVLAVPQIGQENVLRAMTVQSDGKIVLAGKRKALTAEIKSEFEVIRLSAPVSSATEEDGRLDALLFPNPCTEQLHIQTKEPVRRLEILDELGRLVHVREMDESAGLYSVSTENLSSGLYFLKIHDSRSGQTRVSTFVKQ